MSTEVVRRASDYEITVDGRHAGFAAFEEVDGATVLTHTKIDPAFEGQGIGGQLARGALDDLRARRSTVVPQCSFIRGWIDRHPEYEDLVQGSDGSDRQA